MILIRTEICVVWCVWYYGARYGSHGGYGYDSDFEIQLRRQVIGMSCRTKRESSC